MRQDHRRRARAVAVDRADIAAGEVQKAVELVLRVVKAPGAGPAVGPAEDRARPVRGVDAAQFRGDPVERLGPRDRHEFVAAAPAVGSRAALQPAAPDHRPGDPRPVRHRGRDVAEQRRGIGVARMRHDLDAAPPHQHRTRPNGSCAARPGPVCPAPSLRAQPPAPFRSPAAIDKLRRLPLALHHDFAPRRDHDRLAARCGVAVAARPGAGRLVHSRRRPDQSRRGRRLSGHDAGQVRADRRDFPRRGQARLRPRRAALHDRRPRHRRARRLAGHGLGCGDGERRRHDGARLQGQFQRDRAARNLRQCRRGPSRPGACSPSLPATWRGSSPSACPISRR